MPRIIPFSATGRLLDSIRAERLLTALAAFYLFSIFWGTYRFYTPVPVLDMWGGYLDFYMRLLDGQKEIWWAQHNEHRPVLARSLFYLDHAVFGGRALLLIPLNVILLFATWYMVLLYAAHFCEQQMQGRTFYYLLILLTVFGLSWKQDENIIWAFQGQFWLAYLLPLAGFYLMARAMADKSREKIYLGLSLLCGVLSAGTMANGVFSLPLLTAMSLLIRTNRVYSLLLALCSVVVVALYFSGYQSPADGQQLINNIVHQPWRIALFFIEYVGVVPKNIYASFVLGLLHLYLIAVVLSNIRAHRDNPFYLSAVAFLLYYLASALVTSVGRFQLGYNMALMGRYTTPALISMSLSFILYLYVRPRQQRFVSRRTVLIIAVLMLGTQARTVIKNVDKIHDARDRETMHMVVGTYYQEALKFGTDARNYRIIDDIANRAYARGLSIFGMETFKGRREVLSKFIDATSCQRLDYHKLMHKPTLMLQLSEPVPVGKVVHVTNLDKKITGYGLPSREYRGAVTVVLDPSMYGMQDPAVLLYRCN